MLTQSDTELPLFQVVGRVLKINHSHELVIKTLPNEETKQEHVYYTAIADILDDRSKIIEAIIASKYTPTDEIATINNKETKPEDYTEYQNFRTFAKSLADQYLSKKTG